MRKKDLFLIIISVLTLFVAPFVSVSAQEIDIENMDNAELLALLQAIMQKLEDDGSAESITEEPEPTASAIPTAESDPDPVGFEIYETKKLTVEKLPDYMFIRKPNGSDDDLVPYDRLRDLSQKAFDNDYLGVRSMFGFTSAGDLYDFWQETAPDNDWDQYEKQLNDYINSK